MKCTLWTETLEFSRLKGPSSRFALHGLASPKFTVCALFLPLIHGLCAFAALDTCLDSPVPGQPLSSRFALHGLRALEGTSAKFFAKFLSHFSPMSSKTFARISLSGLFGITTPESCGGFIELFETLRISTVMARMQALRLLVVPCFDLLQSCCAFQRQHREGPLQWIKRLSEPLGMLDSHLVKHREVARQAPRSV